MQKILILIVVIGVVVAAFFAFNSYIYHEKQGDDQVEGEALTAETFTDSDIGYTFAYHEGADGYVLEPDTVGFSQHPDYISGVMLTGTAEHEAFHAGDDVREGPPTIQVRVYDNVDKLGPSVWVDQNPQESNIELAIAEPDEAVVGGANAVHFIADGLWPIHTYAVAHDSKIFLFSGMIPDTEGQMYDDFTALIDSVTFIPTASQGAPQAKINVQAVCEGALAYMTFTDGEAADAFVAECIAGEHPEVIEQYIDSLELDGAAI